jgi:hypothetical protein
MSERATQLIFESHKSQSQFAYFQLGLAASAIAFAVHQTASASLTNTPWPIGLGVALWAISFALGCFGIDARQNALLANAKYLQLTHGIAPAQADEELAQLIKEMEQDVGNALDRPVARFRWQKWLLFAGALAYIAGHVMQMAATPPKAQVASTVARPA